MYFTKNNHSTNQHNTSMKNLILCVTLALFSTVILAQNDYSQWQLGVSGGKMVYNGDKGNSIFDFDQPFQGHVGLRLSKYLNENFDLYLGGSMGRHGFTDNMVVNDFLGDVTQGQLGVQYKILKGKFKPFVSAGLGLMSYKDVAGTGVDDSNFQIPLGIGAKLPLHNNFGLWWHSWYGLNFGDEYDGSIANDNNDNHMLHELGLGINFGKQDRDGDGIGDRKDDCPDVPGLKEFNGCPDSDGDGLKDEDDDCPNVAGLMEFKGCPDTDGDGVIDKMDDCPEEAGTVDGCPDGDSDGVADKDDACPEVAQGPNGIDGCPDGDGDGVVDKDDACPTEAGSVNGCPDGDGDGVADINDNCPEVKGDMADGCPSDSDGDGVRDDQDECPQVAGTVKGCPDADGDGFADKDDECPNERGVAPRGCPKRIYIAPYPFGSGSSLVYSKSRSIEELDVVVSIMRANPTIRVIVEGHTDNVGSEKANERVALKRAEAVKAYLIEKGVDASRLSTIGVGEAAPVGDNNTAEGRKQNRRVEFRVQR